MVVFRTAVVVGLGQTVAAFFRSTAVASSRTATRRRLGAAGPAAPRSTTAPAAAADRLPPVNASRAAAAGASPARPGGSPATVGEPPRGSRAASGIPLRWTAVDGGAEDRHAQGAAELRAGLQWSRRSPAVRTPPPPSRPG
ncbi:hypothetical protein [Streptomyces hirsutus]|uniref:hypothetical protein n=1 Tax=Streptomyces hirsutus TaxID=35620 RepID=UPI003F4D25E3